MKKLILIGAASIAAIPALFAQTLDVMAAGYSGTSLFQTAAGHTLGGLDVDAAGNVYYLDIGPSSSSPTQLVMRPALGGTSYGAPSVLFDFGAKRKFGSFVRVHDGEIYFGESSDGTILHGALQGTAPISAHAYDPDNNSATYDYRGNYDFAFSGPNAYLVDDFGNAVPHIYQFNLSTGVLTLKVNVEGEFAGPLAFDGAGNLIYGGSGTNASFGQGAANLYRLSAGVLNALGPGRTANRKLLANNDRNGYLAWDGGSGLFQDSTSYNEFFDPQSTLLLYDLKSGTPLTIGGTPAGDYLGTLADIGSGLFVTVSTGFGAAAQSAVYLVAPESSRTFLVVPEPSASLLVAMGLLPLLTRRLRRFGG